MKTTGYTLRLEEHISGHSAEMYIDESSGRELVEAFGRAMIALTFHPDTVRDSMEEYADEHISPPTIRDFEIDYSGYMNFEERTEDPWLITDDDYAAPCE